jgi:hypothetical protein
MHKQVLHVALRQQAIERDLFDTGALPLQQVAQLIRKFFQHSGSP